MCREVTSYKVSAKIAYVKSEISFVAEIAIIDKNPYNIRDYYPQKSAQIIFGIVYLFFHKELYGTKQQKSLHHKGRQPVCRKNNPEHPRVFRHLRHNLGCNVNKNHKQTKNYI